jgi:transcriptional regulator with XRE-family HTH domain
MDNKTLGTRLKTARERLGLTQEALVERLGKKTVASISEYENGKRRLAAADLPDFARALQVPVSYFYADVLAENDLEGALMDWFRQLPTPRSRDYAYRLIQNVIPNILRESGEAVELPEVTPKPVRYEIKKRKKSRPFK